MSFFFSIRLFLWSTEALWIHFSAQASKTLLRRRCVPSPHREGAWGLHELSEPRARGFLGFLRKPRNISLFLSFTFLSSTPDHQESIKGPQQLVKPIVLPSLSSSSIFSFFFFSSTNIPCLYISPKSTSALLIEEERTLGSLIPFFILGTVFLWPLFCALNIQVDFSREIPAMIEIFEVGRLVAAATKSLQLCPTLCDPIDSSPQGYRIPGILQERTLEWVAISFSNA